MLYKHGKDIIEANGPEDAERILGTKDFKAYRKPSEKAFMMWCWLRCDRKDGRLMRYMMGEKAPFLEEYVNDPNIVMRELRQKGIRLGDWLMIGEDGYDVEKHSEWFYVKENIA